MGDVQRAIDMGYHALYSTCWYLDLIEYGTKWPKYYTCDPADSSMGKSSQNKCESMCCKSGNLHLQIPQAVIKEIYTCRFCRL